MDTREGREVTGIYDVIIIGGGPAGLTAGLYAGRAGLSTLILEGEVPGGQMATSDEIENYPGVPSINGAELASIMREQAEKFGARMEMAEVESLDLEGEVKRIKTDGETYLGRTVIIASGARPRELGVPGERRFRGRGVSYCATCDGAFFREREIAVVGGGDSAVQEAIFLTRFARKVTLIHRRNELRAVKTLQDKAFRNSKIEFLWDSVVKEIQGGDRVEGLAVRNVQTGKMRVIPADGVFIYIGVQPNSTFLPDSIDQVDGYVVTDERMQTSCPGVFAAGDIRPKLLRQISTAVGDGATAAMAAEQYLESLEVKNRAEPVR